MFMVIDQRFYRCTDTYKADSRKKDLGEGLGGGGRILIGWGRFLSISALLDLFRKQVCSCVFFDSFCNKFANLNPRREAGAIWCLPLSWMSGLSFDSTLMSPLVFFCLLSLFFLSFFVFFSAYWPTDLTFSRKIVNVFCYEISFLVRLFVSRKEMVVGRCYVQYAAMGQ